MDTALYRILWIVFYAIFLALNIYGVALSYKVTLVVTLVSLAVLVVFWISAFTHMDFGRWALNIGVGPDGKAVELPEGGGEFFPFGFSGVLATLPFAVWLFLAIEQLPLAAEELIDPKRDMPRGILLGICDAADLGVHDRAAQPVGDRASAALRSARRLEPLLDGFRAIYGKPASPRSSAWWPDRADRLVPHHHLRAGPADLSR